MSRKVYWPLCADVFTWWDKIRVSYWLFTERIWTYGSWVRRYEERWERFLGSSHAIMVSSGSTANELIALRRKWELERDGQWPLRNKVVFPVNTWISSVSPWINAGFEPIFTDVNAKSLNMSLDDLIAAWGQRQDIGTVFYTALLGFVDELDSCAEFAESRGARFLLDACEASFSIYGTDWLLNYTTCSTSIFYSHFTTSGTEGGIVFTQDDDEADWFRMMRNHGMTRGMPEHYRNPEVNSSFDFYLMGSNYRSSNLQAFMASLDIDRAIYFSLNDRLRLFVRFSSQLDDNKYSRVSPTEPQLPIPLAIPILCRDKRHRERVESHLKGRGVETRPIIGGCLLKHRAFSRYGDPIDYPVANWAHECGLYIGIHKNVTDKMIDETTDSLNRL